MKLLYKLKPMYDDDFLDHLHYFLTPTIFTTLALLIAAKQVFEQPILCWAPTELANHNARMQYVENYCFMENTYHAGDKAFPTEDIERKERKIFYYQWVAFILMGQVLMLLAPKFIWNASNWQSINMINEKFFFFVWFWLIFLLLINSVNLCIWIFQAHSRENAEQFVRDQLRLATPFVPSQVKLTMFVQRGLCLDGITALRLIKLNCDPTVSSMHVLHLWKQYQQAVVAGQIKAKMIKDE